MTKVLDKTQYRIDDKKIVDLFLELVKIDSPSRNERQVADFLKNKLGELGLEVYEDSAGQDVQGNTGNIIGILRGNKEGRPILFSAHMDTVVSNLGVNPIVEKGIINTDGRTILGGDDKAGITAIIEALRLVKEENRTHGDIYLIFTVAEEAGLFGSQNADLSKIQPEMGFVLDSGGDVGSIIITAPTEEDINIKIYGKSAHAGVNPEDGINAIMVAGRFLSKLKMGRIDEETTANIGVIKGGHATNIVPDYVEITGEVRSRDEEKLKNKIGEIECVLTDVCDEANARFEIEKATIYKTFLLNEEDLVVKTAMAAVEKIGLESQLLPRGGGSDANIFNEKGIPCVNLGIGMERDHTNEESIKVDNLLNAVRLLLAIIENATT